MLSISDSVGFWLLLLCTKVAILNVRLSETYTDVLILEEHALGVYQAWLRS